jgi:membrane protein YdbS with pleckstrin-like domain
MSKLDAITISLSFYTKIFFSFIIMILISSLWLASNYPLIDLWVSRFVLLLILSASIFVLFQYRYIKQLMNKLEHEDY